MKQSEAKEREAVKGKIKSKRKNKSKANCSEIVALIGEIFSW
jgi:hypothetical protein